MVYHCLHRWWGLDAQPWTPSDLYTQHSQFQQSQIFIIHCTFRGVEVQDVAQGCTAMTQVCTAMAPRARAVLHDTQVCVVHVTQVRDFSQQSSASWWSPWLRSKVAESVTSCQARRFETPLSCPSSAATTKRQHANTMWIVFCVSVYLIIAIYNLRKCLDVSEVVIHPLFHVNLLVFRVSDGVFHPHFQMSVTLFQDGYFLVSHVHWHKRDTHK